MKNSDLYHNNTILFFDEIKLRSILVNFLNEDIGVGDITSDLLIDDNINADAQIICKNEGKIIVSGLQEAKTIFNICNCDSKLLVNDGDILKKGTTVMNIAGPAKSILKAERTALNLIMHMSGISTKTFQFVKKLGDFSKSVRIASTRKTSPGLRYFDKKAVILGGGISHRSSLDKMILIKDNHITIAGSVKNAIKQIKSKYGTYKKIECEVTDYEGLIDAIHAQADIIMLDNFTPEAVQNSLEKITHLGIRNKITIEVSGGITLDNIYRYASSMPDVISIGALTHSFQSIDFSLEIQANQ